MKDCTKSTTSTSCQEICAECNRKCNKKKRRRRRTPPQAGVSRKKRTARSITSCASKVSKRKTKVAIDGKSMGDPAVTGIANNGCQSNATTVSNAISPERSSDKKRPKTGSSITETPKRVRSLSSRASSMKRNSGSFSSLNNPASSGAAITNVINCSAIASDVDMMGTKLGVNNGSVADDFQAVNCDESSPDVRYVSHWSQSRPMSSFSCCHDDSTLSERYNKDNATQTGATTYRHAATQTSIADIRVYSGGNNNNNNNMISRVSEWLDKSNVSPAAPSQQSLLKSLLQLYNGTPSASPADASRLASPKARPSRRRKRRNRKFRAKRATSTPAVFQSRPFELKRRSSSAMYTLYSNVKSHVLSSIHTVRSKISTPAMPQ